MLRPAPLAAATGRPEASTPGYRTTHRMRLGEPVVLAVDLTAVADTDYQDHAPGFVYLIQNAVVAAYPYAQHAGHPSQCLDAGWAWIGGQSIDSGADTALDGLVESQEGFTRPGFPGDRVRHE